MSEKPKKEGWLSKIPFLKKIKNIKHFEIVIAVILFAIILMIYFGGASNSETNNSTNISEIKYTSASEYAKELESKLSKVLGNVRGAGQVSVMISLSTSSELIIAKSVDKKTTSETTMSKNGDSVKTENIVVVETPIIISQSGKNQPLILLEIMPKVAGVVVVASGAKDTMVRLDLLKAVQALLNVPSGSIEILSGK